MTIIEKTKDSKGRDIKAGDIVKCVHVQYYNEYINEDYKVISVYRSGPTEWMLLEHLGNGYQNSYHPHCFLNLSNKFSMFRCYCKTNCTCFLKEKHNETTQAK